MRDPNPIIHVDQSSIKQTVQTRIDGADSVDKASATSPLYLSSPPVKAAADALVAVGKRLGVANGTHRANQEALKTSAKALRTAKRNFDTKFTSYAATLEDTATKPEDVTAAGAVLLDEKKLGLIDPIRLLAAQDGANEVIKVHARYPSGVRGKRCAIEVSPTPATATSFVRQDGDGVTRMIPVPAPGTYAVRAATMIAGKRGSWLGPVMVTIK